MYWNNPQQTFQQVNTQWGFPPFYQNPMQMMQPYMPTPLWSFMPANRCKDSETETVKEYSGKLYVEEENGRPHLVLETSVNRIYYVRPDKLYNQENFYIVEFRNVPRPTLIFEKDFLDTKKFLNQLEMGCHKQVKQYKRSARRTAELLRNYFSSEAIIAEIKFYCGWTSTADGWTFSLANGKTHGIRPLDFASDPKTMKPALDDNKDASHVCAGAKLHAAEQFATLVETIPSTAQRGVIFLWLHISALYSLLDGLGFRFPLGFCLYAPRVKPYQILKKMLAWYGDSQISLSGKKDGLIKSVLERKDQPLFLCDNGENSDNIGTLVQMVQTGNVSHLRNGEEQWKLQAPPVVLANTVSPLLVSPYFFTLDVSSLEFEEDVFATLPSLTRYLPDYFLGFSGFIEKNIEFLRDALDRGYLKSLTVSDAWEISSDGCVSLGIFYSMAEVISEYYAYLDPQSALARHFKQILTEDWGDYLLQVFQNTADCSGNFSNLATTFMSIAKENLLRGNFEKRFRDGKPMNNDESTGEDGIVYYDEQFLYFSRTAFSSVCKLCDASGPMVIQALRDANMFHGQSVNSSTVMTRITTYDVYGCAHSERVYKFKRSDISTAYDSMCSLQGGLR